MSACCCALGAGQSKAHRLLTNLERLRIQGYDRNTLEALATGTLQKKAAGNAYPVPMLAAVLLPVLRQLRESGVVECDRTGHFKSPQQLAKLSPPASILREELIRTLKDSGDKNCDASIWEHGAPANDVLGFFARKEVNKDIEEWTAKHLGGRVAGFKRTASSMDMVDYTDLEKAVGKQLFLQQAVGGSLIHKRPSGLLGMDFEDLQKSICKSHRRA